MVPMGGVGFDVIYWWGIVFGMIFAVCANTVPKENEKKFSTLLTN